jgi:hypothetical protein
VDAGSPDHEQLVIDEHGQPRLKKLPKAAQRASVRELEAAIHSRLPERQIIEILVNIAHDTKYDLSEQNLLAEYHIRYGGWGGIAYHHDVSVPPSCYQKAN